MKIHNIFVEPANYTQDLIENVYQKLGIEYSFLRSESIATDNTNIVESAQHIFEKSNFFENYNFLWNKSRKNDLIIINGYNSVFFILLWFFSIINGCFVGIESDTPYKKSSGVVGLLKKVLLSIVYQNSKIIGLPGGNGLHRDFFLQFGMPSERVLFLPMMVNNAKFYKPESDGFISYKDITQFIYVGRLDVEKNVQLLVEAFKSVSNTRKDVELLIIGDGACRNILEKLIQNSTNIKFLGKKFGSELLTMYHNADVLVLPSSFEPWGLVVNEALAAGVAVIASSAVGSANDLILKPNSGWIFENNNKEDLTNILSEIIADKNIILDKAKNGQEFMKTYWNYSLYTEKLNEIIEYVTKH